jgi:hypothetical protein
LRQLTTPVNNSPNKPQISKRRTLAILPIDFTPIDNNALSAI